MSSTSEEITAVENVEINKESSGNIDQSLLKKKPINFRTEILKGVHSPSDVLSPFSQKISSERNLALKKMKPKSLMDRLLSVKSASQLGVVERSSLKDTETNQNQSEEVEEKNEEEQLESEKEISDNI